MENTEWRKVDMFFILDRSGSMHSIRNKAIEGYNTFITEQKKIPGEAVATLNQFDHEYETVYENIPLSNVTLLNSDTFQPRGSTALYDAIYHTSNKIKEKYKNVITSEIPAILVIILTDGEENSSIIIKSQEDVKKIIDECRGYGWEFIYLAANQDAFGNASRMGISTGNTLNYVATGDGISGAYRKMSKSATKFRSMSSIDYAPRSYDNLMNDDEDETNTDKK